MVFASPTDVGSFTSMVDKVGKNIDDMGKKLDECSATFDQKQGDLSFGEAFVNFFTRFLTDVREQLAKAIDTFTDFLAAVGDYLSPGNPFAMFAKHEQWSDITSAMTAEASNIEGAYLRADSTWKGAIGERYGDLASRQAMAVAAVTSQMDALMTFLSDYAHKVVDTWIAFAEDIINYTVDQIQAASEFISANPLEWADIVPKVVSVVANLLKLGSKLAADMGRNYNDTTQLARGLRQGLADQTGLPGGTWPGASIV